MVDSFFFSLLFSIQTGEGKTRARELITKEGIGYSGCEEKKENEKEKKKKREREYFKINTKEETAYLAPWCAIKLTHLETFKTFLYEMERS
jgi:hypothetical protein